MNKEYKVTDKDFNSLGEISSFAKNKIKEADLNYQKPNKDQRDEVILDLVKYLLSDSPVVAGEHRKNQWEDGWRENYEEYCSTKNIDSIVPKYFDKYNIQRLNGDFVHAVNLNFEAKLVQIFQYIIFEKYFSNSKSVYEFGAGTGHNLLRLREINKDANLFAMEWAKSGVDLINKVASDIGDKKLFGHVFDNFNPDHSFDLQPDASVYTFAALEQLGDKTDDLIDFWIENGVSNVVNIEPMSEPLDDGDLLQYLSIQYFRKRNYLKDYIKKLKSLETEGKVKIHEIIRTGIGSLYIEGYSIISWSPVKK